MDSEFVFFLKSSVGLEYLVFFPHQAVYEVPADLDDEEDVEVLLGYIEELQPAPFEINLEILREIAEENDLLD